MVCMSDGSEPTVTQGSVESAASVRPVAAPAAAAAPTAWETPRTKVAPAAPTRGRLTGAWWTLPAIAAGMGIIAAVMVVAQVEENRQIAWQKNKLQMDL